MGLDTGTYTSGKRTCSAEDAHLFSLCSTCTVATTTVEKKITHIILNLSLSSLEKTTVFYERKKLFFSESTGEEITGIPSKLEYAWEGSSDRKPLDGRLLTARIRQNLALLSKDFAPTHTEKSTRQNFKQPTRPACNLPSRPLVMSRGEVRGLSLRLTFWAFFGSSGSIYSHSARLSTSIKIFWTQASPSLSSREA